MKPTRVSKREHALPTHLARSYFSNAGSAKNEHGP